MVHAFHFASVSKQLICRDLNLFFQIESLNVLKSRFKSQSRLGFARHCVQRRESSHWFALVQNATLVQFSVCVCVWCERGFVLCRVLRPVHTEQCRHASETRRRVTCKCIVIRGIAGNTFNLRQDGAPITCHLGASTRQLSCCISVNAGVHLLGDIDEAIDEIQHLSVHAQWQNDVTLTVCYSQYRVTFLQFLLSDLPFVHINVRHLPPDTCTFRTWS